MAINRRSRQKAARPTEPYQAEKLAYYADRLARGDSGNIAEKAQEIIDWALQNGKDAFIEEALSLTRTDGGWDDLWGQVTDSASIREYTVEGTERQTVCVELVAVPVILSLDSQRHPHVPLDLPDLDWLTDSFREHGLKDPENEVLSLMSHLWSLDELNALSFTEVIHLTDLCREKLFQPEGTDDAPLIVPGMPFRPEPLPENSSGLFLRYLVGLVAYPGDTEPSFLREGTAELVDQWRADADRRLSDAVGGDVMVLPPDNFFIAQENGITEFHLTDVKVQLELALEKNGMAREAVQVIISEHGEYEDDGSEVRVAAYGPDEKSGAIFTHVWELARFEFSQDIADWIADDLEKDGITNVTVIEEVLELEYDQRTGEPKFVQPNQLSAKSQAPAVFTHDPKRTLH